MGAHGTMPDEIVSRQYVRYALYRVRPEWRARTETERQADRQSAVGAIERFNDRMVVQRTYSTVGTRGDCDLLIWSVSEQLDNFTALQTALNTCDLGPWLETAYSYLAMTKRSM